MKHITFIILIIFFNTNLLAYESIKCKITEHNETEEFKINLAKSSNIDHNWKYEGAYIRKNKTALITFYIREETYISLRRDKPVEKIDLVTGLIYNEEPFTYKPDFNTIHKAQTEKGFSRDNISVYTKEGSLKLNCDLKTIK